VGGEAAAATITDDDAWRTPDSELTLAFDSTACNDDGEDRDSRLVDVVFVVRVRHRRCGLDERDRSSMDTN